MTEDFGKSSSVSPPTDDFCPSAETDEADDGCEGCHGSGIRCPASASCAIPAAGDGWTIVERCDLCELYSDDLAAARALFQEAIWVTCAAGGDHAAGRYLTWRWIAARTDAGSHGFSKIEHAGEKHDAGTNLAVHEPAHLHAHRM